MMWKVHFLTLIASPDSIEMIKINIKISDNLTESREVSVLDASPGEFPEGAISLPDPTVGKEAGTLSSSGRILGSGIRGSQEGPGPALLSTGSSPRGPAVRRVTEFQAGLPGHPEPLPATAVDAQPFVPVCLLNLSLPFPSTSHLPQGKTAHSSQQLPLKRRLPKETEARS